MRKSFLALCVIGLMACGTASASEPSTRYVAGDGESELVIDGGVMSIGAVPGPSAPLQGFRWSEAVTECSDAAVHCIRAERLTFAALKAQAHAGDTYSTQGMHFTVAACDDALCTSQQIVGDCDRWTMSGDTGACTPFEAGESGRRPDIRLTYTYVVERGIVSIEMASGGVSTGLFTLSGGRALLAP